ncbi:MAG TPA: TetR/AcrR family transcriptional regulator [Acidimicrobiales bacterium]|nr:TetR/AcrR family transcriptional regulator [Acidimicrobiales bacterium]
MTETVELEAHRPPGRPRSPEADRAILRATVDLLADEGYGGVTMEGVATRAGVGKATVYRRWSCKSALVVDAVTACRESGVQPPDTGSTRDDLLVFVRGFMHHLRTSDAGRVMPALVAELSRNPELAAEFREGFVQPRRAKVLAAVRRGVERGEVRAGVDAELVADGVVALLMHRFLVTGMEIDDDLPERVADMLWRGIARPA